MTPTLTKPPLIEDALSNAVFQSTAESSLYDYIKQAWPILESYNPFIGNWHIELISEYLELVAKGEITRLIINIPPKHLKSKAVSVLWPTWTWIKNPSLKWMFCSHAMDLSVRDSRYRRQVLQSEWYQKQWGHLVRLAPDQNAKTEFENEKLGAMVCKSVGSSAVGREADFIVIDDPIDPMHSFSETKRNEANRWIDQTISTRLNNKATGSIVLVMQRVNDMDPTGYLLKKKSILGEQRWTHLVLPAFAESRTMIHFPVSGRELIREEGDILFPKRESEDILNQQKIDMGEAGFVGQYQQRPTPLGGGMIKSAWWRYYSDTDILDSFDQVIQSWDMSFKDSATSSYVVGQIWGKSGARRYLLDQIRFRGDFVKTLSSFIMFSNKWPEALVKLVEDKANGPAIISSLSAKIPGIIPINPRGSKPARLSSVSPYIEAGNVFLPSPDLQPWVEAFIVEFDMFPNGADDDQVDATSQALNYLKDGSSISESDKPSFTPSVSSGNDAGDGTFSQINPW